MPKEFKFTSTIKDVQNRMVANSIRDASNLQLLKSEEAIKDVIKSYTDRFRAVEGMLTDAREYTVESKELVSIDKFNKFFESIYIDFLALYTDLTLVSKVLNLNLDRNKNYYLIVKKRMRDLWNRLRLTRLNTYDTDLSSESFFESFGTSVYTKRTSNIKIDKKYGVLYLDPKRRILQNRTDKIKSVTSTQYPTENKDIGIINTTNRLNTLKYNYSYGPKDMLRNGLFKSELISAAVPEYVLDVGDGNPTINKSYRGLTSVVDIEFTYPVEINRLDADIFGDFITDIDTVLYKSKESDPWEAASLCTKDTFETSNAEYNLSINPAKDSGFDIISIQNISTVKCRFLRLVFLQENYTTIDNSGDPENAIENKIYEDLSERRYETLDFGPTVDERLSRPTNPDNESLLYKINNLIESTRDIDKLLTKVNNILVPPLEALTLDFKKSFKFELGAWSIEPFKEEYTPLVGSFDSKPYTLKDGVLISASLSANQDIPSACTCNWYINMKGKSIPVLESSSKWRKEPIYAVNMDNYRDYVQWPGTFILLDLPVDTSYSDAIGIYENGAFNYRLTSKIAFLNSRLLYLHGLTDPYASDIVVRYAPAIDNCVNLYVLNVKPGGDVDPDVVLGIVGLRRAALEGYCAINTYDLLQLSDLFTVTNALATREEAEAWFGSNFTKLIFRADEIYIDDTDVSTGATKLSSTVTNISNYYSDSDSNGLNDFTLSSPYLNVAPLSIMRNI